MREAQYHKASKLRYKQSPEQPVPGECGTEYPEHEMWASRVWQGVGRWMRGFTGWIILFLTGVISAWIAGLLHLAAQWLTQVRVCDDWNVVLEISTSASLP